MNAPVVRPRMEHPGRKEAGGKGRKGGIPSRGRQIARGGGFTIFRCCVSYEALYFHLVKHVGPDCRSLGRRGREGEGRRAKGTGHID